MQILWIYIKVINGNWCVKKSRVLDENILMTFICHRHISMKRFQMTKTVNYHVIKNISELFEITKQYDPFIFLDIHQRLVAKHSPN